MTGKHEHNTTPINGPTPVGAYVQSLEAQRDLLTQLEALSRRQAELIEGPELEPLLALLDARQGVINRVMTTREGAEGLRAAWEAMRSSSSDADCQQVQRALEAIARLAGDVSDRDEHDHVRLHERLEGVTAELAGLATSRRAGSAYGAPTAARAPRFQDRNA